MAGLGGGGAGGMEVGRGVDSKYKMSIHFPKVDTKSQRQYGLNTHYDEHLLNCRII